MLKKRSTFLTALTCSLFLMTTFFSNFALASTSTVMITGMIAFNDFDESWPKATLKVLSGYQAPIDVQICSGTYGYPVGKFFVSLPVGQKTVIGLMESGVGPICTLTLSARSLDSVDVNHTYGKIPGYECFISGNPASDPAADDLVIRVEHEKWR